jgi:hypothetical protein
MTTDFKQRAIFGDVAESLALLRFAETSGDFCTYLVRLIDDFEGEFCSDTVKVDEFRDVDVELLLPPNLDAACVRAATLIRKLRSNTTRPAALAVSVLRRFAKAFPIQDIKQKVCFIEPFRGPGGIAFPGRYPWGFFASMTLPVVVSAGSVSDGELGLVRSLAETVSSVIDAVLMRSNYKFDDTSAEFQAWLTGDKHVSVYQAPTGFDFDGVEDDLSRLEILYSRKCNDDGVVILGLAPCFAGTYRSILEQMDECC